MSHHSSRSDSSSGRSSLRFVITDMCRHTIGKWPKCGTRRSRQAVSNAYWILDPNPETMVMRNLLLELQHASCTQHKHPVPGGTPSCVIRVWQIGSIMVGVTYLLVIMWYPRTRRVSSESGHNRRQKAKVSGRPSSPNVSKGFHTSHRSCRQHRSVVSRQHTSSAWGVESRQVAS